MQKSWQVPSTEPFLRKASFEFMPGIISFHMHVVSGSLSSLQMGTRPTVLANLPPLGNRLLLLLSSPGSLPTFPSAETSVLAVAASRVTTMVVNLNIFWVSKNRRKEMINDFMRLI
jgi:hypothetical protein